MTTDAQITAMRAFPTLWHMRNDDERRALARRLFAADFGYVDVHTPDHLKGVMHFWE